MEQVSVSMHPSEKRLFSLLVGINDYRIKPLTGCLTDVNKVKVYLQKQGLPFFHTMLLNEEASKEAIVTAFNQIKEDLTTDDTFLFYFSGHGTREIAGSYWKESSGMLQCIVCYNCENQKSSNILLADKELRYLIRQVSLTGAHVLTIFDCCHSGDNTRNAPLITAAMSDRDVRERRLADAFPERNPDEFIFAQQSGFAATNPQTFLHHLPEGRHVQLAACEQNEAALEINREGVFTKVLLQTLQLTGGQISYSQLQNRIRQYMRFIYEQQPRIYAYADSVVEEKAMCQQGFLNLPVDPAAYFAEAVYNNHKGWLLNVGAIHGLNLASSVGIFHPNDKTKIYPCLVKAVYVDHAILELSHSVLEILDEAKRCDVTIEGLYRRPIKLRLCNWDGHPEELEVISQQILNILKGTIDWSDNQAETDYDLHIQAGECYLTMPADPYRPLIRPIVLDGGAEKEIGETVKHIADWHFIKELQNREATGTKPLLQIQVFQIKGGIETEIFPEANGVIIPLVKRGGDFKVKITNHSNVELFVSGHYLSKDFSVFSDLLPRKVEHLGLNDSVYLSLRTESGRSEVIPAVLDDYVSQYNWLGYTEQFQFIISAEEFNPEALQLNPLPHPCTLGADRDKIESQGTRSFLVKSLPVQFSGWFTQSLQVRFLNPFYNQVASKQLQNMLSSENMDYFARGLYFDVAIDETLRPTDLALKNEITILEGERSFFDDIKINLANGIERRLRDRAYRRKKDKPGVLRLVAEGDSWFQYPLLVKDILDHLSPLYAVKSLAAAGDTLRNYMQEVEFLTAIEEEQPLFFLISGGGNDILGEQFQSYLADTIPAEVKDPEQCLHKNLEHELASLEEIFRTLFRDLLQRHPELHIITHGYDYVIPLDTSLSQNHGRQSWLGKYLVQKGVPSQELREAVIRMILDRFNDRLQSVCVEFDDKVSYLDLRGTVNRSDYWYDEIHPTNEGFQDVAMRFIQEITKVMAKKRGQSVDRKSEGIV